MTAAPGCGTAWCVDHHQADAFNPATCAAQIVVDITPSVQLEGAEHLAVIPYADGNGGRHVEVCAFDPWGDVLPSLAPEHARALGLALVRAAEMVMGGGRGITPADALSAAQARHAAAVTALMAAEDEAMALAREIRGE